jgi:hypothetical protein
MYQIRAAVQDAATERIGTSNELVEAPDVDAGGLGISGLLISGKSLQAKSEADIHANPAVRVMRLGMQLSYSFILYNPPVEAPQTLETRIAVFRDGKAVYVSPISLPAPDQQSGGKQIVVKGKFNLGPEFSPGNYVLQIAALKKPLKGKVRVATRWIEFEVTD